MKPLRWVLTACCVGQFMSVLDVSAMNIALPVIQRDLHFDQQHLMWAVNAYTLVLSGFLLFGGRLADLFGRRRVFLGGIALFTLASLLGGLAASPAMLVLARGFQGLGAAVMVPATLTVLTTTFTDPVQRGKALGLWAGLAGAGASVGGIAGGAITELFGWRWTLLVNVPIGLFLIALTASVVTEQRATSRPSLDVLGTLSVTGGLIAFVYGIAEGSAAATAAGVGLLCLFLYHESRIPQPLVPLSIFRHRSMAVANATALIACAAFFSAMFFMPLLMQQVLGYSPLQTALYFLPMSLAVFACARGIAKALPRFGPRPILVGGLVAVAAGLAWLSLAGAHSSYLTGVLGPIVLVGSGWGLVMTSSTVAATSGLPMAQAGLASGLLNTTRQLGGSIGLAVLAGVAAAASSLSAGYSRGLLAAAVLVACAAVTALALPVTAATVPGKDTPMKYPFSDPSRLDLDPGYAQLRERGDLVKVELPYGGPSLLATRYEDVKTVLGDLRFSRARAVGPQESRLLAFGQRPDTMVAMDPPEHTRLRRVVAKAFTMRRIDQLRPRVQEIVDELLTTMDKNGAPADLCAALAWPLPVTAICELLGVPFEDRAKFQSWTDIALSTQLAGHTMAEIQHAIGALREYLAGLVQLRRSEPGDDLITVLVQARDEDERLSEDEMVGLGVGVLVAGHETTANQIGNFAYLLLSRPELLAQLQADPQRVPQAIEELLRYTPLFAGSSFPRVATQDVTLSSGFVVKAGESVLASMMAANRDPNVFADPDDIDFSRTGIAHLSFGHGPHRCLGAQLARLELDIALTTLVTRYPGLRLAVPADEVPFRVGTLQRGPAELMVTW